MDDLILSFNKSHSFVEKLSLEEIDSVKTPFSTENLQSFMIAYNSTLLTTTDTKNPITIHNENVP